jgi:hypothetical protein
LVTIDEEWDRRRRSCNDGYSFVGWRRKVRGEVEQAKIMISS